MATCTAARQTDRHTKDRRADGDATVRRLGLGTMADEVEQVSSR